MSSDEEEEEEEDLSGSPVPNITFETKRKETEGPKQSKEAP